MSACYSYMIHLPHFWLPLELNKGIFYIWAWLFWITSTLFIVWIWYIYPNSTNFLVVRAIGLLRLSRTIFIFPLRKNLSGFMRQRLLAVQKEFFCIIIILIQNLQVRSRHLRLQWIIYSSTWVSEIYELHTIQIFCVLSKIHLKYSMLQ